MNNNTHTTELKRPSRGRLRGNQLRKLYALLDMMYTPAELSAEVGFSRRQIYRVYRHLGMPCVVKPNKRLLINGKDFREWYLATYSSKVSLGPEQAYCRTCGDAVAIKDAVQLERNGLVYLQGHCPVCNRVVARILRKSKR